MNLVGGFVVTDRMLEMFKGRAKPAPAMSTEPSANGAKTGRLAR